MKDEVIRKEMKYEAEESEQEPLSKFRERLIQGGLDEEGTAEVIAAIKTKNAMIASSRLESEKDNVEREVTGKQEAGDRENYYQNELREYLPNARLDERDIDTIITEKKIRKNTERQEKRKGKEEETKRPTYTRMARKHLSLETLRAFRLDFQLDEVSYDAYSYYCPISPFSTSIITELRQMKVANLD